MSGAPGSEGGIERGGGLVLIGFRGVGKTSVGRLVAARMGRAFVDLDSAIESSVGQTSGALIRERGEGAFREVERSVLVEQAGLVGLGVLATGGGVVLRAENRAVIRRVGFVVWLQAETASLAERLSRDPGERPSLTGRGLLEEIEELARHREPLYRETADLAVATDGLGVEGVAERVIRAWGEWRR